MKHNLHEETVKHYQDLFPSHDNNTAVQDLHERVDRLLNVLIRPGIGATWHITGALFELLDYLQTDFYATPVRLASSADSLLFLRIRRLLEDTHGRLSRAELAKELHYNGGYLNEVVQRHTGKCLFEYGMTLCMQEAARLLEQTELPITEIAAQLRFTNRTHFYTLFRKHYGMTPQQYRTQHKTGG